MNGLGFIIRNNEILCRHDYSLLTNTDVQFLAPYFLRYFKLGIFNDIEYFCAEIDADIDIPEIIQSLSLRSALSMLKSQYGMVSKAYSIINWDKNHKFCSRCSAITSHLSPSFERVCTICSLSFFPRISPSIIVLIKRGDNLLMARSPHFPAGVYGLIAGFVEAGESAEEAVRRETREEVGLEIKNLSYVGSQSWPFPDALMLAFTAEYLSGDILIDQNEIEAAGWYRYDNLPGLPSTQISIASSLITDFISSAAKI